MKFFAEKNITLVNADIHLHYANNRGRGDNNVTVTIVKKGTERPMYTRQYADGDIIRQYRTSGWAGNVNIPQAIIDDHGGFDQAWINEKARIAKS